MAISTHHFEHTSTLRPCNPYVIFTLGIHSCTTRAKSNKKKAPTTATSTFRLRKSAWVPPTCRPSSLSAMTLEPYIRPCAVSRTFSSIVSSLPGLPKNSSIIQGYQKRYGIMSYIYPFLSRKIIPRYFHKVHLPLRILKPKPQQQIQCSIAKPHYTVPNMNPIGKWRSLLKISL